MLDINAVRTALQTQMAAINVTGANVANVNTPGYSRQSAILASTGSPTPSGSSGPLGVKVDNIERIVDKFVETQIVGQEQAVGYNDITSNILGRVESLLNESDGGGLGDTLSAFWDAWQDLANNPTGTTEREQLLSVAGELTQLFRQDADALENVRQDLNTMVSDTVSELNVDIADMVGLNKLITQAEASGQNASSLRDQRFETLRKIGGLLDVSYVENADGSMNVYLKGGGTLVEGSHGFNLAVSNNNVVFEDSPGTVINNHLTGGKLGGVLELRDTTVAGYIARINDMASAVVNNVNAQHALGYDLNGNGGGLFFDSQVRNPIANGAQSDYFNDATTTAATLLNMGNPPGPTMVQINGKSVSIDLSTMSLTGIRDAINGAAITGVTASIDGTGHFLQVTGASGTPTFTDNGDILNRLTLIKGARNMTVTSTLNADGIAASSTVNGDGGNARQIASISNATVRIGATSATIDAYHSAFIARIGQDTASANRGARVQQTLMDQLQNQREQVSGVSIDEEMINLMKYQMGYQAAGKLFSTVDQMLQTLIALGR